MKRAILFDLMGTLLVAKTRQSVFSMYEILEEYGLSSDAESFILAWGEEKSIPSQNNHTPFEERIYRVAEKLGWKINWPQIELMAGDICDKAAMALSVDHEAMEILRKLRGRVELGVVTNYDHPPAIYKMLADTNLSKYFSVVTISGEIGIWKPDPGILQAAIKALSLPSRDCIFIGDSSEDIDAAISAGVNPVLILRKDNLVDPFRNPEKDLEKKYRERIGNHELRIISGMSEVEELL
jgi:HAD superfamily hydrolase (TIGR01509 family)